jgi:hypothetical protein
MKSSGSRLLFWHPSRVKRTQSDRRAFCFYTAVAALERTLSPSELEEYLSFEPKRAVRLTLSSGDQLIVFPEDRPFIDGIVLILRGEGEEGGRVTQRARLVSVPNVVFAEPFEARPGGARRKRR